MVPLTRVSLKLVHHSLNAYQSDTFAYALELWF